MPSRSSTASSSARTSSGRSSSRTTRSTGARGGDATADDPDGGNRTAILSATSRRIATAGIRGLRVEEVAREAGVSTALLYYHFGNRRGLLMATLEHVEARADAYSAEPGPRHAAEPVDAIAGVLTAEFADDPAVRENSAVWGEFVASAVFDPDVRETLARMRARWVERVARHVAAAGVTPDKAAPTAERLVAVVDGLSPYWLAGIVGTARAQALVRRQVEVELAAGPGHSGAHRDAVVDEDV